MMKVKVLLVDPCSVFHGPPTKLKVQDISLSSRYSKALDKAINERMDLNVSDKNWNAIYTNYVTNYGLLMLGFQFKQFGWDVDYINGDYYRTTQDFFKAVECKIENAQVICFTATTPQYSQIVNLAESMRKKGYSPYYVLGGPHSYYFLNNYEFTPFDLICVGHNIFNSAKYIREMVEKNIYHQNVCFFEGYVDVPKDFTLIPKERLKETLLYSYTTYGCPNNCHYCVEHYFNPKICYLDLSNVIKEIRFLVETVGIKSVHLADSDFFFNSVFAWKMLELIQENQFHACYTVNTSPNTLCRKNTVELIKAFYKIGLIEILIGIEYFSDVVLTRMNKSYDIKEFEIALSEIRIECPELIISFYSLVGLPGENELTRRENYYWFERFFEKKLVDYSFPKFFVPYPGTDVFEHPEQFGVEIIHTNWEEYHRWALPRPIKIQGMADEKLLDEVKELYAICGASYC